MIAALLALALGCGTERWAVKTLSDPAATSIDFSHPVDATVTQLRAYGAPAWQDDAPRAQAERVVYRVKAVLIGAKLEADQDFHVVIADPADTSKTMIVEVPSPRCLDGAPKEQAAQMLAARHALLKVMRVGAAFKKLRTPKPVTVTGVAFFDKLHGQTGVAPNGVELHPVLALDF